MEHVVNEPVNEVNQSEHNNEDHFLNRQDIENIVAQGIANAIPAIVAAVNALLSLYKITPVNARATIISVIVLTEAAITTT